MFHRIVRLPKVFATARNLRGIACSLGLSLLIVSAGLAQPGQPDRGPVFAGQPSRAAPDICIDPPCGPDPGDLPVVNIVATDNYARERWSDPGLFTISRTGATTASLTVYYAVSGTAVNGQDYPLLSGSLTIPAGSASATITISPTDDCYPEPEETVILTLSSSTRYAFGSSRTATVTIAQNDFSPLRPKWGCGKNGPN